MNKDGSADIASSAVMSSY